MLDDRRRRQIFQTVTCRLEDGENGPPASYSDEEKEYYLKVEAGILEDREKGIVANYHFPCNYD